MLQLQEISKEYKKRIVLDKINFSVLEGDSVGVIGNNGAGKSTMLSIIATIIKPSYGKMIYRGTDINKSPEVIRRELGYVPQDIALFEELSGLDNLKFWGKAYRITGKRLTNRIEEICNIINIDPGHLNSPVKNYSGGMKRRINIGSALLHEPHIVILDEPTVGLDEDTRSNILGSIKKLNEDGVTIICTGHYMNEIRELCNKICHIDSGKVVKMEENEPGRA